MAILLCAVAISKYAKCSKSVNVRHLTDDVEEREVQL